MEPIPILDVECDWCTNPFKVNTLHQVKLYGAGPVICKHCRKIATNPPRIDLGYSIKSIDRESNIQDEIDLSIDRLDGRVPYRSFTGLKFLRGCIKRSLEVQIGPIIEYSTRNIRSKYQVSFCVPKLKLPGIGN